MRPVFVIGAERSGTTILGALLGSPSSGLTVPESHFFFEHILEGFPHHDFHRELPAIWEDIKANQRFKDWELPVTPSLEAKLLAHRSIRDFWTDLVRSYGAARGRPNPEFWVDHTPGNTMHTKRILEIFPDARFVHIVRDPRAVAASVLSMSWGPNDPLDFCSYWLQKVAAALAAQLQLPDKVITIRYEDLLESSEQTISLLREHLVLPPISSSQEIHFEVPTRTHHLHRYIQKGLMLKTGTHWREQLDNHALSTIEGALGEILEFFGYERLFPRARVTLGERLSSAIQAPQLLPGLPLNWMRACRTFRS